MINNDFQPNLVDAFDKSNKKIQISETNQSKGAIKSESKMVKRSTNLLIRKFI
jgi:hypothetical protein